MNQFYKPRFLAFVLAFMILPAIVDSQLTRGQEGKLDSKKTESNASAEDKDKVDAARKEFDQAIKDWKQSAKDALMAMREFSYCEREDAEKWRIKWREAIAKGNDARDRAAAKALTYYKVAMGLNDGERALALVLQMVQFDVQSGRFNRAWRAYSELETIRPGHPEVLMQLGILCMKTNRFEQADEIVKKFVAMGRDDYKDVFEGLDEILAAWKIEQKLREQEKGKLPQVKLVTSKGTIVLELFENQAPETVANFITLVRDGFYEGRKFHRVIAGFMAQTGCPNGDGLGDAGYSIYDEHHRADVRKHYRGVVSMANIGGQPNSGGSQFFFTVSPQPILDAKHTVFGRIIKGDEVLERLKTTHEFNDEKKEVRIDGVIPDEIISVEVVNDSGKEYKFRKVPPK